jgi:N-acetylneuraminic acid mutarotase
MNAKSVKFIIRLLSRVRTLIPTILVATSALSVHAAPPAGISQQAMNEIKAVLDEKSLWTPAQAKMDSALIHAVKKHRGQAFAPGAPNLQIGVETRTDGRVLVDIRANVTSNLLGLIEQGGGEVINNFPQFHAIRAAVKLDQLETLAAIREVTCIRRAVEAVLNTGSVNSQGDVTHTASAARTAFGVTGTGIKIGVLSDSVDYLSNSQAKGDLGPVTVLPGQSGVPGTGEGTAMLEIIHDLAPDSPLYFATAFNSEASFAQNILNLYSNGCNIIVDDVWYLDEPPFQDGIVAQAVNAVTANGALYFSSAGNSGNMDAGTSGTWEGDFSDGGVASFPESGIIHSFGLFNYNTLTSIGKGYAMLFWSDPLDASTNDYDLFLLDSTGSTVLSSSVTRQNGTQDPFEILAAQTAGTRLVIIKYCGAPRFLHLSTARGRLSNPTAGCAVGHSTATNAFSVAAVNFATAYPNPFVGGGANPVETFSSDGPRRVFYQTDGTPISPGDFLSTGGAIRQKPDIAAADGVSTSLSGFNPFFGTSAAAPHAAAIAALICSYNPSLTPAQVRIILTSSALDIGAAGVDRDSGVGIVMAYAGLTNYTGIGPVGILIQPTNQSILEGGSATFSVTAFGPGSLNYSWWRNGFQIPSATSPNYTVTNGQFSQSGSIFRCLVTNSQSSVTSSNAMLSVTPAVWDTDTDTNFSITISGSGHGCSGSSISPSGRWCWVDYGNYAEPSSLGLSYIHFHYSGGVVTFVPHGDQLLYWSYVEDKHNAIPVSDGSATSVAPQGWWSVQTLTINSQANPSNPDTWTYTVHYEGHGPSIFQPPAIYSQPANFTASISSTAFFFVQVNTGNLPCTRQWRCDGLNLTDGGRLAGVTSDGLTISNVQASDLGDYSVVVANSIGAITSAVARLTVLIGWNFELTGPMRIARSGTGTLLPNGQVLTAGGPSSSAELYDPTARAWILTGAMSTSRTGHTSTLLSNGKVMVAGGYYDGNAIATNSSEIYDPSTGIWITTGAMNTARYGHTATLLTNGKILVAGGKTSWNSSYLDSAEIYDPQTGLWSPTRNMNIGRTGSTAMLLPDGRVLVVGGYNPSYSQTGAELYDPDTKIWTSTSEMISARVNHTATLLASGKVLVVAGGINNPLTALSSTELYDPATDAWTPSGSLSAARFSHSAALLSSGKVLIAGGYSGSGTTTNSAEIYDPIVGTWTVAGAMNFDRAGHTATLLSSGKVLVAGGGSSQIGLLASAELYGTPLQTNSAPVPPGIVAWWPGERTAIDIVGTNNGITLNGVSYSTGEVGQAFSFDGVNDYVSVVPYWFSNNIANNFTIEFWVYPTAGRNSTTESTSGTLGISAQRYAIMPFWGGTQKAGAGVSVGTNGVSIFEHGDFYLPSLLVYEAPIFGWTHVAVVYTNKQPSLYVNGSFVRTGLKSLRAAVFPSATLGGSSYGYFAGLLDEVSIYDRALTPDEIASIYNARSAGKYLVVPPPVLVSGWGANSDGQTQIPASATNVVAIAAGAYHSLALRSDGWVIGWGRNDFGETNAPGDLTNAVAIAGGWGFSLAAKSNHTVASWGWPPVDARHFPSGMSNVTAVAAGWDHAVALRDVGTVATWGSNAGGQTNVPPSIFGIVAVSGNGSHTLALKRDGTVAAWGDNGTAETNVLSGLQNVAAISAGAGHNLALRWDGSVAAWGDDSYGQTDVPSDLTNAVAIAAGGNHSLALRQDGSVVGWGWNGDGEISMPATLSNVVAIAAGRQHSLALLGNGSPAITVQPFSRSASPGEIVHLGAMAVGQPVLNYQWFKGSDALLNNSHFSGVDSSMLIVSNFTSADVGPYSVTVTNTLGLTRSKLATLTLRSIWFDNVRYMESGQVELIIGGTPGDVFCLETSSNLFDWEGDCTLTNAAGTLEYIDTPPADHQLRFYRLVVP